MKDGSGVWGWCMGWGMGWGQVVRDVKRDGSGVWGDVVGDGSGVWGCSGRWVRSMGVKDLDGVRGVGRRMDPLRGVVDGVSGVCNVVGDGWGW